jgi:hypothetical protein
LLVRVGQPVEELIEDAIKPRQRQRASALDEPFERLPVRNLEHGHVARPFTPEVEQGEQVGVVELRQDARLLLDALLLLRVQGGGHRERLDQRRLPRELVLGVVDLSFGSRRHETQDLVVTAHHLSRLQDVGRRPCALWLRGRSGLSSGRVGGLESPAAVLTKQGIIRGAVSAIGAIHVVFLV